MSIAPINLRTEDMAEVLGFSVGWLKHHMHILIECGAIYYDGRWHIASTEEAFCTAARQGLLGRAGNDKPAVRGRASKTDANRKTTAAEAAA